MFAVLADATSRRSLRRPHAVVLGIATLFFVASSLAISDIVRVQGVPFSTVLAAGSAGHAHRTCSRYASRKRSTLGSLARVLLGEPATHARSAWLDDNGVLALERYKPFDSVYRTVPQVNSPDRTYTCDSVIKSGEGVYICENRLEYVRALKAAGDRALLDGAITDPLPSASDPLLHGLAGKRILLMGDSIERFTMIALYNHINGTYKTDTLAEPSHEGPFEGPGGRVAILSTGPADTSLPLRIDFLHYYGLDEDDVWGKRRVSADPNEKAFTASDRFEAMGKMWHDEDGRPAQYDVIVLDFGLWELARYQLQSYTETGFDSYVGLPAEFIADFATRGAAMIAKVRAQYPSARIVWRHLHAVRWTDAGGWFTPDNLTKDTPRSDCFTPLRIFQLRQAQRALAEAEGIELFTWASRMLGQGAGALADSIHPNPPGCLVYAEMLFRLTAETC